MASFRVLLTDNAWEGFDIEHRILAECDAELIVAEDKSPSALATLARENKVDAIMSCWALTTAEVIGASPRCRHVARLGIGLDNIDVDYCTRQGIPVTNVPDYCWQEVAEHTLALLFSLVRNLPHFHLTSKRGNYELNAGISLRRIEGQTLGLVGLGGTGRRVAELAQCFGMHVIATSRSGKGREGVEMVDLKTILKRSDSVSLHLPLTEETRHLIGRSELLLMKPTAFLINTSRGGLVDHEALAHALEAHQIAGAALDVQEPEPPNLDLPPFNDSRVIVTPHVAFASVESVEELRTRAARQVATLLTGGWPENIVNGIKPA